MLKASSCRVAAIALVCAGPLAACSSSGVRIESTPPPASTPSPSAPATDPRVQAAIDAYLGFSSAYLAAQSQPFAQGQTYPAPANFVQFSFDPLRGRTSAEIWGLAAQGVALRGTSPERHVEVASVALTGAAYPTVTLTDCPTSAGPYGPVRIDTGKAIPTVTPTDVTAPPPHPATATVIFYRKHWGVQDITHDVNRTCAP